MQPTTPNQEPGHWQLERTTAQEDGRWSPASVEGTDREKLELAAGDAPGAKPAPPAPLQPNVAKPKTQMENTGGWGTMEAALRFPAGSLQNPSFLPPPPQSLLSPISPHPPFTYCSPSQSKLTPFFSKAARRLRSRDRGAASSAIAPSPGLGWGAARASGRSELGPAGWLAWLAGWQSPAGLSPCLSAPLPPSLSAPGSAPFGRGAPGQKQKEEMREGGDGEAPIFPLPKAGPYLAQLRSFFACRRALRLEGEALCTCSDALARHSPCLLLDCILSNKEE